MCLQFDFQLSSLKCNPGNLFLSRSNIEGCFKLRGKNP